MDISNGALRDYGKCPKMYRNKHVLQLPADRDFKAAFVGSVLGHLLESFYRDRLWTLGDDVADAMEELIPAAAARATERNKILWFPEEEALYRARAAAIIPVVITTIKAEKLLGEVNLAEYEMVLPVDGHVVHGRTDLTLLRNGVLTVLDEKAGGSVGKYVDIDQLKTYALLTQADPRFKRLPDRIGFWWLKHGQISWKKFSAKAFTKLMDMIRQRLARIDAGDFAPTPSKKCKLCDYRVSCEEGQTFLQANRRVSAVPMDSAGGEVSL